MAVPGQLRFLRPRRQRPFLGTAGGPYIQALEVFAVLHWALSIYVAFILWPKALPDVIMPTLVLAAFWSPGPGSLAFVIAACVSRGLHALWITWGFHALLTAPREPLHFRLLPVICALAGAVVLATALLLWERRRLFVPPGLCAMRWRIAAGILVALATLKLSWVGPLLRPDRLRRAALRSAERLARLFGGDVAKQRLTYPSIPDISRGTQYSVVRSEG